MYCENRHRIALPPPHTHTTHKNTQFVTPKKNLILTKNTSGLSGVLKGGRGKGQGVWQVLKVNLGLSPCIEW